MRPAIWRSLGGMAMLAWVACGDDGGGSDAGAEDSGPSVTPGCSVGTELDWGLAIIELQGAAPMGEGVGLWFRPFNPPSRLLIASPDGGHEDAGELGALQVHPTGTAARPAFIVHPNDASPSYLPITPEPAAVAAPVPLFEPEFAADLHAVLWTGAESLVVVRGQRSELFPDSGEAGVVQALLRVDPDGVVTEVSELEDAPSFGGDEPLYVRIGSTVVSVEQDATELTLLQHALTGGAPVASTSFDTGGHHQLWVFGGDAEATLVLLRGDALELIPIGPTLERGESATIALGEDLTSMAAVDVAPQAGGWTLAHATPHVEDGTVTRAEIRAQHFDASLQLVTELASTCSGRSTSSAPTELAIPPHATEPTLVWRFPPTAWLGFSSF